MTDLKEIETYMGFSLPDIGLTEEQSLKLYEWLDSFELEQRNVGCQLAVSKLRDILETGEHKGVFGYFELEQLAQDILDLMHRGS
jgi:hypothetical protein